MNVLNSNIQLRIKISSDEEWLHVEKLLIKELHKTYTIECNIHRRDLVIVDCKTYVDLDYVITVCGQIIKKFEF